MDQIKDFLDLSATVKSYIDHLLEDPHRPGYHFAEPEGLGRPGDPNGAFYSDGRYHLMYLYDHQELGFCWGHISSIDLVHWRRHKDCLVTGNGVLGCFSGGAYVDDDQTAYISFWDVVKPSYWGFENKNNGFGGIRIAYSKPPYEKWDVFPDYSVTSPEITGITTIVKEGKTILICAADTSNIWKNDGIYYMQSGNFRLLNKYGRKEDTPPELRGDWTDLFASKDLKNWNYLHRFYKRDETNKWTDETEDDMCPSFFPLPFSKEGGKSSDKYLQLFISHNKGCQYYIGEYDKTNNVFIPQNHGRMSWSDRAFFAPEALMDSKGRQIMWAWFRDVPSDFEAKGWCGVFSLPRTLWINAEDNTLRMAPLPELEMLRINRRDFSGEFFKNQACLNVDNSLSCEIELVAKVTSGGKIGFRTLANLEKDEYADILYDSSSGELQINTLKCAKTGWPAIEKAPFMLGKDEVLSMRVFIDKSVLEVFVNERQAAGRRAYPQEGGDGLYLIKEGEVEIISLTVWEMHPSNPY